MVRGWGDPISLARAHPDSEESSRYSFERLEAVIAELADSRRQLLVQNANLREQIAEQDERLQGLDERLLEANQRRQDALKRIDDLIAHLDQVDSQFLARRAAGATSTRPASKRA